MKKIWKYAILLVVLSALLCMSAFATDGPAVADISGTATVNSDNESFAVSYEAGAANAGKQYLVLMLAGTSENSMPDPTVTKILYVNQTAADATGKVVFDNVYPTTVEDSVIWLTGGSDAVALASVTAPEEPQPTGVTVSGTVTSYGKTTNAVTVTLSDGVNTYTTTTLGGMENAEWSFSEAIPAGNYILTISKAGHGSYAETIVVGTENVVKSVKIYLIGDINMDGKYTSIDTLMCKRIVAETLAPNEQQAVLADINKDGKYTSIDTLMMKRLVAETYSVE